MITKQTLEADYLPARMLNELTYCPRLFYYEHVDGVFADNQETVEGTLRHSGLDAREDGLPPPEALAEGGRSVRARSVTLSSDTYGVIAKMDLIECHVGSAVPPDAAAPAVPVADPDPAGQPDVRVTPVDYKRGRPREAADGSLEAWDTDKIQLAVQALVLRDNGYCCDEAIVYYVATKQRIRIPIDATLVEQTLAAIQLARNISADGRVPPPLVDSPKCPRCSLVAICLPDETNLCLEPGVAASCWVQKTLFETDSHRGATIGGRTVADQEIRRLVPARDDLRPLYLNTQGLSVGKSGETLKIKDKDKDKDKEKVVQEVRLNEICQLSLMGNIQITTQAIQALCEAEIPIAYFSMGGWFYGITQGLGVKNIFLRREQFRLADVPAFCLRLARALVAGKIANQRTLLQRNHVEPPATVLAQMKCMQQDAEHADSLERLLGYEGNAARLYFQNFAGMLKVGDREAGAELREADQAAQRPNGSEPPVATGLSFDFANRNRRPPRDPVNALLSLAYSLLAKDLTIVTQTVGFDPYLGYFHQPRFGRASLGLDLMEPFRPLIADSSVLSAINTRMVTLQDFVRTGNAVALTADGRKKFFRAYEQRMDTLVTHPLFGYRVNYRRLLEIQCRLLAKVLTGELSTYPVFTTR
ncbi:MAG: CRISPR-associated endonuclease Cas1 [Planctomycetota bacterium]|nr:CRISPR-associated endonuclease Cas1 [Planctomycetota bacterium]